VHVNQPWADLPSGAFCSVSSGSGPVSLSSLDSCVCESHSSDRLDFAAASTLAAFQGVLLPGGPVVFLQTFA
jgi:hypothetical protein